MTELRVPFQLRGMDGLISVSVSGNTNPGRLGYLLLSGGEPVDFAQGFPVCRAAVTYPADGYAAVFGWTQLVRSTDSNAPDSTEGDSPDPADGSAPNSTDGDLAGFEMDPIAIYRNVATPYAWYGFKPEFFDAPSRSARYDMDWLAHAFLCVSPDAVLTPRVQAVAGFSWGFTITGADISLVPPAVLGPDDWDGHLALLRACYPSWTFDADFAERTRIPGWLATRAWLAGSDVCGAAAVGQGDQGGPKRQKRTNGADRGSVREIWAVTASGAVPSASQVTRSPG